MNRPARRVVKPDPRAELLRIEPEEFFALLEHLEDTKTILRANGGTLFRTTQFGIFVKQESGVLIDLVSGLFIDPESVEAIYRVQDGERETFEIRVEDMGIPLTVVPGRSCVRRRSMNAFASIPVDENVPLDELRSLGAGAWLDEALPFQPEEELRIGLSKSSFGQGRFDLQLASPHLGITIQIQVTYSDRDGSCFRLWDASSESVVFLRGGRRPVVNREMEAELLAC